MASPPELLKIANEEEYASLHKERVLDKLDAQKVFEELGKISILLCYEKYSDIKEGKNFCHRILVAKWLEDNIPGLSVKELGTENAEDNKQISFKFI